MMVALVAVISLSAVEITGGEVFKIFDSSTTPIAAINEAARGIDLGGGRSEEDENHFLSFVNKSDVDPGSEYFSNIVIAPNDVMVGVAGNATCALVVNGSNMGMSAALFAGDQLSVKATSSSVSLETVSCEVTTSSDSGSWKLITAVADTTPDPFAIADVENADPNSSGIMSETFSVSGFTGELEMTASGGIAPMIFVNGVGYANSALIQAGDEIFIVTGTPETYNTPTDVVVSLGGVEETWTVTTRPAFVQTFGFTGDFQTFTVPDGISKLTVKSWGAGGGGGRSPTTIGGGGGFAQADIIVSDGEELTVAVGGGGKSNGTGGFMGGGIGYNASGGGGGYSGVFGSSILINQSNALIIAGGGGGGGDDAGGSGGAQAGGGGGGLLGGNAGPNQAGHGGSQTEGGLASTSGTPGQALQGGNGGFGQTYGGAGGGGGYFGGGGGGTDTVRGGAAGGGSGYVTGSNSLTEAGQGYQDAAPGTAANTGDDNYVPGIGVGVGGGFNGGDGLVVIIY